MKGESKKNELTIPGILFIFSLLILSFNLSEQGPHQDEVDFYYSYSIVYFDLIKDVDFFHPCWNGNGDCERLSLDSCDRIEHWITTQGFVKHLLVGTGVLLHGDDNPNSYSPESPLCKPHNDPISGENIPTKDELSAARFFSPILGSLTVVLSYLIGKFLFSRTTGIIFSVLLLFNALWFAYSRTITAEPYLYFFMMLSFFLLLYSFRKKEKVGYTLLVLSGIVFAIAFNTKAIVFMILPVFILTIFLRNSIDEKLTKVEFRKVHISKSIIISILFVMIIMVSIIGTFPFYWIGPFEQIELQRQSLNSYNSDFTISFPWNVDSKFYVGFLSTITVTFAPIIDTYYENFTPNDIPSSVESANNFSSIPLSILFSTGIGFLIYNIKIRKITGSELLVLFWAGSIFILLSLMVESYSTSRFFIMMFLPMLLIGAYGYHKFFISIKNIKLKIFSFILTILAHAITTFVYWEKIFYKPDIMWLEPLFIKSQEAITQPEVILLGTIFSIFFVIYGIKRLK